jgi:serine/threonine protein kinase
VIYTEANVYLIMEYCAGGDLVSYVSREMTGTEFERRWIFFQIILGLNWVHECGIAHRDLKPENIILDDNLNAKICDFGFARHTDTLLTTPCGSVHYVAPEVIQGGAYDGLKADIWSLGIILYVLETGHLPWTTTNNVLLCQQISQALYEVPVTVDEGPSEIISMCVQVDPAARPTTEDLLNHPFLKPLVGPRCAWALPRTQSMSIRTLDSGRVLLRGARSRICRPKKRGGLKLYTSGREPETFSRKRAPHVRPASILTQVVAPKQ